MQHSRRILVTGAAQGIGLAIARRFLDAGETVALLDRHPDIAEIAEQEGGVGVQVDLADVRRTQQAVAQAADHLGGIDVLVNNAGVFRRADVADMDIDEWDLIFAVNARAVQVVTQAALPHVPDGGRVISIASMGGKEGTAGESAYCASKAAVIAWTRVAARELGGRGITVNCLCPGYVLTEMGADSRDPADVARWTSASPLGRLGRPDDIAGAVAFLAGPDAGYLTGQAINVTGGMIMH